jgi:hypothetical protein
VLSQGTFIFGPVYIEPKTESGAYDREIFLTLKEFSPSFAKGRDMAMDFLAGTELPDLKARATLMTPSGAVVGVGERRGSVPRRALRAALGCRSPVALSPEPRICGNEHRFGTSF